MTYRFSDEKVSYYSKSVEVNDYSVFAKVTAHAEDGHKIRNVGLNWFQCGIFRSVDKACVNAHKWADARIRLCETMESQYERSNHDIQKI